MRLTLSYVWQVPAWATPHTVGVSSVLMMESYEDHPYPMLGMVRVGPANHIYAYIDGGVLILPETSTLLARLLLRSEQTRGCLLAHAQSWLPPSSAIASLSCTYVRYGALPGCSSR